MVLHCKNKLFHVQDSYGNYFLGVPVFRISTIKKYLTVTEIECYLTDADLPMTSSLNDF